MARKQDSITDEHSLEKEGTEYSFSENSPQPGTKKEDLSGGKTGLNSDEFLQRSEFEEEEENLDSLAPHVPYPEMDRDGGEPATTDATIREPGQDIATNKHLPDEKKSELFIDSGIFPFIAMGVLSALFITMMIAALYFARHSSDSHQHSHISMKHIGIGPAPLSRDGDSAFHTVTFRNAKDAVIGDFAINMFAVRQEEREEAKRELAEASESTLLATPANIPVPRVTAAPVILEAEQRVATPLHRDLPDVVSVSSSRRDTMCNNRHSTGSSLYMELMNMCRNTRLLEELALRRKNIMMLDATQLNQDDMFSSDTDCNKSGKSVLRRHASIDSARCRENVPLPSTYESHYFKLYDGDDDDSSALASASANTTMDVMFSGDEGCTSTLSSLHRKGSSKRNSRLLDESRQLLPVQEFFNEALIDSSKGDDVGDEDALYETIDEMGYRRRTASSRAIRRLMEARESAGQAGETVVVENAWESSPKKYDKIDRSIKAYRKQMAKDKDYNTLVV
ncbi:uncharacterized protein LOC119729682 isoform X2 [Patiria miniata]|nr:uncharacterized protein LOC119729682 isoform X2 [Patiria miniata]